MEKTIHQGRNVKRFREMLGIKQDALAASLNDAYPEDGEGNWNQKKVSLLEAKEVIEDKLLEEVAKELKVPVEAIKNFDEEAAINVIGNTYQDNAVSNVNYGCTFNPIDKIVELYEEVLKVEREKNALLERMLGNK
jgi:hypothetical protein